MTREGLRTFAASFALALAVAVSGCEEGPEGSQLIAALRLHRTSLEVVAEQLASAGPQATIDLRGERPVFQPPVSEVIAEELARALYAAEVDMAVNDPDFGGVLFRASSPEITVEGMLSGFVYRTADRFGDAITVVEDLQTAVVQARSAGSTGQGKGVRLAHPVDGRWGIFLQAF